MSSLSVGDLAQNFMLARSGAAMKTSLQLLSSELVSGLADDTAAHLSGDLGPLAGIETSLAQLRGYKAVTTEATILGNAMQTALGTITDLSADLSGALLGATGSTTPAQISALGAGAAQKFETAIAALNARMGDRSLFAGLATTTTPLPTGATLLDTLQGVVAAAVSAADVQAALDDWFAQPTGYAAVYQGGAPLAGLPVASGEIARNGITAMDPALRDTLKGLAMAALIDRDILTTDPDEIADLVHRSGVALFAAQSDLGALTARLGTTPAQIQQAAQRNTAEMSALTIALSDLLTIDSYDVASRLQQTQTQLETLYTLTSRMSRLSLVNFL